MIQLTLFTHFALPPPPSPLVTTNLFSVSKCFVCLVGLFIYLCSTYGWNCMVFAFLHLTYFTWPNTLKVHPYCCKWQDFIFVYDWVVFHSYMHHIFFIHSFIAVHLGHLHILVIVNSPAMNIGEHEGSFFSRILANVCYFWSFS